MPEPQNMAERITPKPVAKKTHEPMVISVTDYKKRKFLEKIGKAVVATATNRAVQAATGVSLVGAGIRLAHDNWVVEENQAEKMARYKPNRLLIGSYQFTPQESDIHTEPNFQSHDYAANKVDGNTVLSLGNKPVEKTDKVLLINPLVLEGDYPDPQGPSGRKGAWLQIPDVLHQTPIQRRKVLGYTPLGRGVNGHFYDILGEDKDFYHLKGHDSVRKDQTQQYKANGK